MVLSWNANGTLHGFLIAVTAYTMGIGGVICLMRNLPGSNSTQFRKQG